MGAFEVLQTKTGKFTFRLRAANGQIILSGETFPTKAAAIAGINAVAESVESESNFDRRATNHGEYYFVLKGSNGRVLGKSDAYASQAGRETAIWSVRKNAEPAEILRSK